MNNVIDFPVRHVPLGPDEGLWILFQDALFAILEARDLQHAREIAIQALADADDEIAP